MILGALVAVGAVVAGLASTGVGVSYFLQPTGALIVLGGTVGVLFITTPRRVLGQCVSRVMELFWDSGPDRDALMDEILSYAKISRRGGLLAIEPGIPAASNRLLREALKLALDVKTRAELQASLETQLRLSERQSDAEARVLETAGGFAPTIGILGTVVGLMDVLRQFSNLQAVGYGIGTAFVSTLYGLALANLLLLPAAHRIRARAAVSLETQEMILEGALCIFDEVHPALIQDQLRGYAGERDRARAQ